VGVSDGMWPWKTVGTALKDVLQAPQRGSRLTPLARDFPFSVDVLLLIG